MTSTSLHPLRLVRPVGLAHLTMLEVSPPDLVVAAAEAGYDAVGLRVCPGGPGEQPWFPAGPAGRRTVAQTRRRLDDTGLELLDVDIVPIRPGTRVADLLPALDLAADLGASLAIAFVEDEDASRAADTTAEVASAAAERGLRLLVEAMAYKAVRTLDRAVALAEGSPGAGVVVDPLQLHRCGDGVDDVRALDASLVPLVQVCDAPLVQPAGFPATGPLPRGQAAGTVVGQLEARAWRLPAGEGELPLAELLAVLPDAALSIEAPNLALSRTHEPAALARLHLEALRRVLLGAGDLSMRT